MARLNTARSSTRASTVDSLYRDRTPLGERSAYHGTLSPSPAASLSSDKENHAHAAQRAQATDKGKGKKPMAPPGIPAAGNSGPRTAKKRRLGEQGSSTAGRAFMEIGSAQGEGDLQYYDPNQDPEERRKVRQGLRENTRALHGERTLLSCKLRHQLTQI
jgi:hypothetical protein